MMGLALIVPSSLRPQTLLESSSAFALATVDTLITFLILVLILFFVWSVGLISRNYFGRKLLAKISAFFNRVPVLSTVYSTLEHLLKTFASGQAKNFRRVVQIEYPRKGLYTLAFVTGERDRDPATGKKGRYLSIYVPTTPNPTSGFYLQVAADEVTDVDMSVEEALKEIISMGIVQHEHGK